MTCSIGTQCAAVCQNPTLHLHLSNPFRKYHRFTCTHYHTAFRHRSTFNFQPHTPPEYLNTDFQPIKTLIFTPTIIIAQPTSHSIRLSCRAPTPTFPSSKILLIE